jgi:heme A synthase
MIGPVSPWPPPPRGCSRWRSCCGGLVYPVNVELATWVDGPVPADWTAYRARWEWGHAIIAGVELLGFAALVGSVLADTPRNLR